MRVGSWHPSETSKVPGRVEFSDLESGLVWGNGSTVKTPRVPIVIHLVIYPIYNRSNTLWELQVVPVHYISTRSFFMNHRQEW